MTAGEIAELLSVPVSWVREHTRSGTIPHVPLGRYIRYDRAEVVAWVESVKSGGAPRFRKHAPSPTSR
jgi:excisionase family DNA binding protein